MTAPMLATSGPSHAPSDSTDPLMTVREVSRHFTLRHGALRRRTETLRAVEDVSFEVLPGETLGLVGESGCGKSTLGRCLLRVDRPTSGSIRFAGRADDVATARERTLGGYRRDVRMVFQDPYASLNPRMRVRDILAEPVRGQDVDLGGLLELVGLQRSHLDRYPHAFSGGERQRVSIARAIATDPRLVVADEAVSALDVSVRAQVLNLLDDLQRERGMAYLFISHDLSVVQHLSDRVAVMYLGRLVEVAGSEELFTAPAHPYTEALLGAVPLPDPRAQRARDRIVVRGELPDPTQTPSGCPFRNRCRFAADICAERAPELTEVRPGHQTACHFAGGLPLRAMWA